MTSIDMNEWKIKIKDFTRTIPEYEKGKHDYGVIVCAGSRHFISSVLLIHRLINDNPDVVIEWYYVGDELMEFQKKYLSNISNITLINCLDIIPKWFGHEIKTEHLKGYMIKPFALMMSQIENILLIDGDNTPLCNIQTLFNNKSYNIYGNVFWKDVKFKSEETKKQMLRVGEEIYKVLDIMSPFEYGFDLAESGQILVNKQKCWKALCVSYYLNYHHNIFYKIFFGDKDLYYVAFQLTGITYYQNDYYPHGIGTQGTEFGRVNVLIQRHPTNGDDCFMHRTLSKITLNEYSKCEFIYKNLDYELDDYREESRMLNMKTNDIKQDDKLCFVTAFYNIGRDKYENNKRDNSSYYNYFKNLLKVNNINLIVLTDEKSYNEIDDIVKKSHTKSTVKIVKKELDEFYGWNQLEATKKIMKSSKHKELVKKRNKEDIEISKPEYVCLMHCKTDFMRYVIDNNILEMEYYAWIDFGYLREQENFPKSLVYYPNNELLKDKVVLFRIGEDKNFKPDQLIRNGRVVFEGAPIVGKKDKIIEFNDEYHKAIDYYNDNGLVDDDQSLMYYIYKNTENLVELIYNDKTYENTKNLNWFVLFKYYNDLSCLDKYRVDHKIKEHDEYMCDIIEKVVKPMYISNEAETYKYYFDEINKSITFTGHELKINNINSFRDNLVEIINSKTKMPPVFKHNLLLLYYFEQKKFNEMSSLFVGMTKNNQYNDETILIICKLLMLLDLESIKKIMDLIKNKYKLFILNYLNCAGKIEESDYKKLLIYIPQEKDNDHNIFLKKCKDLLNYKNSKLVADTLNQILNHKLMIPEFKYPFYFSVLYKLSFNDKNNKSLREKNSRLHRIMCPAINYTSENLNKRYESSDIGIKRKRIGFISTNFYMHSVGRDRTGIIRNMNKDLFDVFIFYFNVKKDDVYFKNLWGCGHNNIVLQGRFFEWIKIIEAQKLDILVYCDLGMQYQTYCLAHCRLAPVQVTTWGHSETSGISTIDYYISSSLYELPEAKNHYSEKLILHKSLCTYYYNIYYELIHRNKDDDFVIEKTNKSMKYLAYLQFLHKISEHDIGLFKQILKKNKKVKIVLINGTGSKDDVKWITDRVKEDSDRFVILPRLKTGNLYELIRQSYLVIDSYPHGGCNTSLESFNFNKVVVTKPSDYLRGRFTQGFYKKMGIDEPIVDSVNSMVKMITTYVNDENRLKSIEKKINKNKFKLFNDLESVNEWNKTMLEL